MPRRKILHSSDTNEETFDAHKSCSTKLSTKNTLDIAGKKTQRKSHAEKKTDQIIDDDGCANAEVSTLFESLNSEKTDSKEKNSIEKVRSLEALFQVTHSELESMEKKKPEDSHTISGEDKSMSEPDEQAETHLTITPEKESPHLGYLPEGAASTSQAPIVSDGDLTLIPITDVDPPAPLFKVFYAQVSLPEGGNMTHTQDIQIFEKTSDEENLGEGTSSEQQPLQMDYDESEELGEDGMMIVTPGKPGRRHKTFPKPGKHICTYCGRRCAKPSVLQKHIRAHTGERPFPCNPCGISFKTKSNLYKHCKSRAHAMKSGNVLEIQGEVSESDMSVTEAESSYVSEGAEDTHEEFANVSHEVALVEAAANASTDADEQKLPHDTLSDKKLLSSLSYLPKGGAENKFVRQYSMDASPETKAKLLASLQRSHHSGSSVPKKLASAGKTLPKLDIKKANVSTVVDRISSLISENDEIINTPMADAPRPKRMNRQISDIIPKGSSTPSVSFRNLERQSSMPSLGLKRILSQPGGKVTVLQSGTSKVQSAQADLPRRLAILKSGIDSQQVQQLMNMGNVVQSSSTPGASSTTPQTQELKIQFRCEPPAEQQAGVSGSKSQLTGKHNNKFGAALQTPKILQQQSKPQLPQQSVPSALSPQPIYVLQSPVISPQHGPQLMNNSAPDELQSGSSTGKYVFLDDKGQPVNVAYVAQEVPLAVTPDPKPITAQKQAFHRSLSVPAKLPSTEPQSNMNLVIDQYNPFERPKKGRPLGAKNVPKTPNILRRASLKTSPLEEQLKAKDSPPSKKLTPIPTKGDKPFLKLKMPNQAQGDLSSSGTPGSAGVDHSLLGSPTVSPFVLPGSAQTSEAVTPQSLFKLQLKGRILMKRSMSQQQKNASSLHDALVSSKIDNKLITSENLLKRSESIDENKLRKRKLSEAMLELQENDSESQLDDGIKQAAKRQRLSSENYQSSDESNSKVKPEVIDKISKPEGSISDVQIPFNKIQHCHFHPSTLRAPLLGVCKNTEKTLPFINGIRQAIQEKKIRSVQRKNKEIEVNLPKLTEPPIKDGIVFTDSEENIDSQLLLFAHDYPILRNHCLSTFCTVTKPQPMYVPLDGHNKLSMYSNWQSATHNPNPSGLTTKQLLELYQTGSKRRDALYTSSGKILPTDGQYTHSSHFDANTLSTLSEEKQIMAASDAKCISELFGFTIKQSTDMENVEKEANQLEVAMDNGTTLILTYDKDNHQTEDKETITLVGADKRPKLHKEVSEMTEDGYSVTSSSRSEDGGSSLQGSISLPLKIVPGQAVGYKSKDAYLYVRGRGRGKYVCDLCGMRCKKPSMLKKHIRSHTDLRPFVCRLCLLSFKTKGNLTKHMKSKSHLKKCYELGVPVSTSQSIDESHIDKEVLEAQNQLARDSVIIGAKTKPGPEPALAYTDNADEDDGVPFEQMDSFEDTSMDNEDGDDVSNYSEEVVEEQVVVDDSAIIQGDITGEGPQFIAFQDPSSERPTLLRIDGDKSKQSGELIVHLTSNADDEVKVTTPGTSRDKEIAAHTLLDLSKQSEQQKYEEQQNQEARKRPKLSRQVISAVPIMVTETPSSQSNEETDARLSSLIGQLKTRTKPDDEVTQADLDVHTIDVNTSELPESHDTPAHQPPRITWKNYIASHMVPPRKTISTYAQKIAALQSANESDLRTLSLQRELSMPGSGFVPPNLGRLQIRSNQIQHGRHMKLVNMPELVEIEAVEDSSHSTINESEIPVVIGNQEITIKTVAETPSKFPNGGGLSQEEKKDDSGENHGPMVRSWTLPLEGQEYQIPANIEQLHGTPQVVVPWASTSTAKKTTPGTSASNTNVMYVTGTSHAPCEIKPIPVRMDQTGEQTKDGKFMCQQCDKVFTHQHQLNLHYKVHQMEGEYKCDLCYVSFSNKTNLQRHVRSTSHNTRLKMTTGQMKGMPVRASSEDASSSSSISPLDPRPFHCNDCNVKFRIQGHLTKHLRSATHMFQLEALGKVTPGTAKAVAKGQFVVELRDNNVSSSDDTKTTPKQETNHSADYQHIVTSHVESGDNNEGVVNKMPLDKVTVEIQPQPIGMAEITEQHAAEDQAVNKKCGICNSVCSSKETLRQHMLTHACLRPYVCQYCDAGFTQHQSLKQHLKTHVKERPYQCGLCGITFPTSDEVHEHLSTDCVNFKAVQQGLGTSVSEVSMGEGTSSMLTSSVTMDTTVSSSLTLAKGKVLQRQQAVQEEAIGGIKEESEQQESEEQDGDKQTENLELKQKVAQMLQKDPSQMKVMKVKGSNLSHSVGDGAMVLVVECPENMTPEQCQKAVSSIMKSEQSSGQDDQSSLVNMVASETTKPPDQ